MRILDWSSSPEEQHEALVAEARDTGCVRKGYGQPRFLIALLGLGAAGTAGAAAGTAGILAGAGGLADAAISGNAANSAAQTQAAAADQSAALQNAQFAQTSANESPFLNAGQNTLQVLLDQLGIGPQNNSQLGPLTAQTNPNLQPLNTSSLPTPYSVQPFNFQQSPGYQFALNQGLDAVTNKASAIGGLQGGNTLKALTDYATGSASQDYQQQFADYLSQQNLGLSSQSQGFNQALAGQGANFNQNLSIQDLMNAVAGQNFSQLQTIAGSGQNAAANLGALGAQNATAIGNDLTGAANATSAAQVAAANATAGGINSGIGNITQLQLLQLLGGGGNLGSFTSGANASGAGGVLTPAG